MYIILFIVHYSGHIILHWVECVMQIQTHQNQKKVFSLVNLVSVNTRLNQ